MATRTASVVKAGTPSILDSPRVQLQGGLMYSKTVELASPSRDRAGDCNEIWWWRDGPRRIVVSRVPSAPPPRPIILADSAVPVPLPSTQEHHMRPTLASLRSLTTLALLTGAAACADLPVEPGGANGQPRNF